MLVLVIYLYNYKGLDMSATLYLTFDYVSTLTISLNTLKTMPETNTSTAMIENPVTTIFTQYQKCFIEQGQKEISYLREYKLAAID